MRSKTQETGKDVPGRLCVEEPVSIKFPIVQESHSNSLLGNVGV